MEESGIISKKFKSNPTSSEIKNCILNTKEPLILKNILSWDILGWSLDDWVEKLGNMKMDLRVGPKQCTKVPQWENNCETVFVSLKEVLDNSHKSSPTWMYFDYKHMKKYLKNKSQLLESLSWADFGFSDKDGKDSTIWIGTQGAYTPCHMDSYGCNIVAQVYGRKLWIMFPPSRGSVLKPTRVPYEESSIYSNINFSCGLNPIQGVGEARVVELSPGDVLIVPKHWWHYVENITTAISINMWIPMESDHTSRLEESLVRFFVGSVLNTLNLERDTSVLNPNEMDLLDETVDLRQISWCLDQVLKREISNSSDSESASTTHSGCVSAVPSMSAENLQNLLLRKCGCVKENNDPTEQSSLPPLSIEHLINAFCHPDVITKATELLISMRKAQHNK